jgi:hypothetical protein
MEPAGAPPPLGEPSGLGDLLTFSPAAAGAVSRLAATTAARLGLMIPPVSDQGALDQPGSDNATGPGIAAVWLAAAVGLRRHSIAMDIARCCPPPPVQWHDGAWDLVARHGVASAAAGYAGQDLRHLLMAASPLSALLDLPAPGGEDQAIRLCRSLAASPDTLRPVVEAFAGPGADPVHLAWRASVLGQLALDPLTRAFVLDVYEAAVALYGAEWRERLDDSVRVLGDAAAARAVAPATTATATATATATDIAFAIGRWWRPLRVVARSHHDAIRARTYLDFNVYWQGLRLAAATAGPDGFQELT